ncbi:TPA: lysine--tRNA ligase [Candidatus Micrarchaeota archaeon]|nr:lysine--tRNA ligase [Candidatus Micrarchaeota archaeon]
MFWADEIAEEISKRFADKIAKKDPLIIRDEKTLSGRVHVGSLRGIVIHGLISQILDEKGIANKFLFELNDFDPMDGLPVYVDQSEYKKHMGKPLFTVPPHEKGAENFPMVFGNELKETVKPLGLPINYYFLRPEYLSGKFNGVITEALNNAEKIRKIYLEVSGGAKPSDWYPLNVICEKCGKVGTTQTTGWDGTHVTYSCKLHLVEWAEGCGYEGKVSPFSGKAKLPWKAEWAAKWKVFGVDVEGCGKDHSASGGSREIAARISEEVFKYPEPFNIPYEFFNFKGKKMSASKGLGASAKEVADMLPPKLLKLLMIRKKPNAPIDFDPEGNTIPNLFDEYDRLSDHYFKRHKEPFADFARAFKLSQISLQSEIPDIWQMRFSTMIFIIQMPHLKLENEAAKLKGSALTKAEKLDLAERAHYVKQWLESYATDEYKYKIIDEPLADLELDEEQKEALNKLKEAISDNKLKWEGAPIHERIHRVKEETGIEPKKIFEPLYQIFLGRKNGPQIGWFLSTFDRKTVIDRLEKSGK